MENCKVKLLNDSEERKVVGGASINFIATATGAAVTCTAGVAACATFIAAMVSDRSEHKYRLYKAAAGFAAISVAGSVSTAAISKISMY